MGGIEATALCNIEQSKNCNAHTYDHQIFDMLKDGYVLA